MNSKLLAFFVAVTLVAIASNTEASSIEAKNCHRLLCDQMCILKGYKAGNCDKTNGCQCSSKINTVATEPESKDLKFIACSSGNEMTRLMCIQKCVMQGASVAKFGCKTKTSCECF